MRLYDVLSSAIALYVAIIGSIWALFSFPERLLRQEVLDKVSALVASEETAPNGYIRRSSL
jgi:hypothetical protein